MDGVTPQNAALVEQAALSAQSLKKQARILTPFVENSGWPGTRRFPDTLRCRYRRPKRSSPASAGIFVADAVCQHCGVMPPNELGTSAGEQDLPVL